MDVLGGDYRFETKFYLDDKRVSVHRWRRSLFNLGGAGARSRPSWWPQSARIPSPASCSTRATTLPDSRFPGHRESTEAYDALKFRWRWSRTPSAPCAAGSAADFAAPAEEQTPITRWRSTASRRGVPRAAATHQPEQGIPAVDLEYCRRVDRRVHQPRRRQH